MPLTYGEPSSDVATRRQKDATRPRYYIHQVCREMRQVQKKILFYCNV